MRTSTSHPDDPPTPAWRRWAGTLLPTTLAVIAALLSGAATAAPDPIAEEPPDLAEADDPTQEIDVDVPPTLEPADDTLSCIPDCRSGYICHEGTCISACNPACDDDEVCTDAGECVEPTPAREEPPPADPSPPIDEPTPADPASSSTPAPAPSAPTQPASASTTPQYVREGLSLGADVGARACFTDSCRARSEFLNHDVVRTGLFARLGAAYRFIPYVAAGAEIDVARHGVKYRDEGTSSASLISWSAVALVTGHPLAKTRWDPFFGLGLGYEQDIARADGQISDAAGLPYSISTRRRTLRGVFRVAFGLEVFLDRNLALGARVTVDRQFAGKQCFEATFFEEDCASIRADEAPAGPGNDVIQGGAGRLFATFGVAARLHL